MTKPTKTAKLLTYPVVKDGSMVLIGKRHYLEILFHYQILTSPKNYCLMSRTKKEFLKANPSITNQNTGL